MIVDPDFFDHWRTLMVMDAIADKMAPIYIMRLWAHCQHRKCDRFHIPQAGVKAICRAEGVNAENLEKALIEAGFLERDGTLLIVSGWAEKNASLLTAWENGKKGGRPKKSNTYQNPQVTQEEPMDNPLLTQTKPIREEKRREEKKDQNIFGESIDSPKVCPHEKIIQAFHEILVTAPKVRSWTQTRKSHLASRWREAPERQTTEYWRGLFEYVNTSDFLMGRVNPPPGRKPFMVTLDWLVKPENFAKLIEGHYENRA